jgi:hypothetical protein
VNHGEGNFTRLLKVSPRNICETPSDVVPFTHVTAPALFRETTSIVATLGSPKAVATSCRVVDAFQDANLGLSFTSTLAVSGTDWV